MKALRGCILLAGSVACLSETPGAAVPRADLHVQLLDLRDGALLQDQRLRVQVNLPLEPSSVLRQSFGIVDLGTGRVLSPPVRYEPVSRQLLVDLISPGLQLAEAGHTYTLRIWAPSDKGSTVWLRSVEGDVLGPNLVTRTWTFRVDAGSGVPAMPPPEFCNNVLPLFRAQCTQCHAGERAAMGMDLSSAEGVTRSALRVSSLLARRTPGMIPGTAPLGTAMPRLEPGNPGISMVLYKTLLAPAADETSEDARARLMLGEAIPGAPMGHLSQADKRVLSTWIAAGASAPDCGPAAQR